MKKLDRKDVYIITQHSNWTTQEVEKILKEHVYSDGLSWWSFIRIALLALGMVFLVSGVVFFFAYNWADMHRFAKLGLIAFLLTGLICLVLFSNISKLSKRILLMASSILVGVLFAVFGQIYQTGANAYDFFLAWVVFISLWVLVADFAPLWLIYLALVNTTIVLYAEQVAQDWPWLFLYTLLSAINILFLLVALALPAFKKGCQAPRWFTHVLALVSTYLITLGMINGIYRNFPLLFYVMSALMVVGYATAIWYGWKKRLLFYLSIVPFSLIVIISALMLKISEGEGMFLLVSLFIITGVTLLIKKLIALQKEWSHET